MPGPAHPDGTAPRRGGWWRVTLAVLARPALWPSALRQTRRLARDGWWHRPPFLPLADPAYLAFRLETQYGRADADPEPADVVAFLRWSSDARSAKGAAAGQYRR
ncbi:MAG TPA: hypothetical protein VG012_05025 [Acidimicrobiia bacterium]|nr:hypothetical protein [Acidimicrobiia bacterium]